MAAKDNRKRGVADEAPRWSNEVVGIILIAVGLLMLLSLVRYSPADLPRWGFLEAFASKTGAKGGNLIGPVGGILGFLQILLFGAAAAIVSVGLIWFGIIKLALDGRLWPRPLVGFAVLLLSGAIFLDAADWFFIEWAERCNLPSPGGVVGNGLGGYVMIGLLGRTGTMIVTGAA